MRCNVSSQDIKLTKSTHGVQISIRKNFRNFRIFCIQNMIRSFQEYKHFFIWSSPTHITIYKDLYTEYTGNIKSQSFGKTWWRSLLYKCFLACRMKIQGTFMPNNPHSCPELGVIKVIVRSMSHHEFLLLFISYGEFPITTAAKFKLWPK